MIEEFNHINKHVSRFIAILSLYSYEMREDQTIQQISKKMKKAYLEKDIFILGISKEDLEKMSVHSPDDILLEQLINLSYEKKTDIEQLIKDNLIEKYSLNKLDKVIKAILCLAALELLYFGEVPAKIIIDEYVGLTKTFYENSETGFINKVIDVLAHKTRPSEI